MKNAVLNKGIIKILSNIFQIINVNITDHYNYDGQKKARILFYFDSYLRLILLFNYKISPILQAKLTYLKCLLQQRIVLNNNTDYHLIVITINKVIMIAQENNHINDNLNPEILNKLKKKTLQYWLVYLLSSTSDIKKNNLFEAFITNILQMYENIYKNKTSVVKIEQHIKILKMLNSTVNHYAAYFSKDIYTNWIKKITFYDTFYQKNYKFHENRNKIINYILYILCFFIVAALIYLYVYMSNINKSILLRLLFR